MVYACDTTSSSAATPTRRSHRANKRGCALLRSHKNIIKNRVDLQSRWQGFDFSQGQGAGCSQPSESRLRRGFADFSQHNERHLAVHSLKQWYIRSQ